MKKLSALILFICLSFCAALSSCTKDDLTKPATVSLRLEMAEEEVNMRTDGSKSFVKIQKARYKFSEMEFEGYRESGNNYFFTKDFGEGKDILVEEGKPAPVLDFDMPQGIYDRIHISLKVRKSDSLEVKEGNGILLPEGIPYNTEAAIIMEGYYTNSQLVEIPLVFVYDFDEVLEHKAGSGNGNGPISISQSASNMARILFNPSYWMQLINSRMLQGASLTLINGTPTIILAENSNENIFNLLTSRIKNASELKFQ